MDWFILSLLGMISLSGMFVAFRKLSDLGANSYTILIFEFLIAAILLTAYSVFTKTSIIPSDNNIWYLLLLVGILGAVGNLLLVQGIASAPNPGYALAVVNANVILVTIAAFFLFKSGITLVKGIGLVLALIGVILIGL